MLMSFRGSKEWAEGVCECIISFCPNLMMLQNCISRSPIILHGVYDIFGMFCLAMLHHTLKYDDYSGEKNSFEFHDLYCFWH